MSRRRWFDLGPPTLALAALLWVAGSGMAQHGGGHGGGGHGGGGHGGGGHGGGGHAGSFHGGGGHAGGFHGGGAGAFHGGGFHHEGFHEGHHHHGFFGYPFIGLGFYDPWFYGSYYPWDYGSGYYGDYGSGYYGDYGRRDLGLDYYTTPYGFSLASPPPAGRDWMPPASDNSVHLRIRVPADAQLWVDDQKTSQQGPLRFFDSPQITPGREYAYLLRARWIQDGKEIDQSRQVVVHAGDRVTIDFLSPQRTEDPGMPRAYD